MRARRARAARAAAIVVVVAGASQARAAPRKPAPHASKKEEAAPALPPPPLTLTVTPGAAGAPWQLRVDNPGELPIRVAADARLLALEIAPPGDASANASANASASANATATAKPVRCTLPDDARPATDEGRELVIPAKRSWTASVDPLFLCFGARERAALVAGANVKAIFGWPARANAKPAPPFAATPVGAAVGVLAPSKTIESAPFTLADSVPLVPGGASAATAPSDAPKSSLVLSTPDAEDVARGAEIPVTVIASNESDRTATLLFRSEVLAFRVTGPGGTVACGTPRAIESPIRELFSTIPAKGRASLTVLLTSMCPPDTFDDPGVYRVFARLDTTGASGRDLGMRTWDGTVETPTPMLLRVRTARRPQPLERPTLDKAPAAP